MFLNNGKDSCISKNDAKLNELLLKKEYSLNSVNNYGDSLLHVSAAYGYTESVKTLLSQNKNNTNVDRKNKFGWTPLMHAIRGNNIRTVEVLLENGSDVAQRTYLGTSTLTLAAGIGEKMFDTIYKVRPSILGNSINDDITPLCVAAMKNDKKLFFKILNFSSDVKNESIYTHLVMQRSEFPEIQSLAKPYLDDQNYWNDRSDNIQILNKELSFVKDECEINKSKKTSLPLILVDSPKQAAGNLIKNLLNNRESSKDIKVPNLDLLCLKEACLKDSYSISPNLIYNLDTWFTKSPNFSFSPNNIWSSTSKDARQSNESVEKSCHQKQKIPRNVFVFDRIDENHSPVILSQSARDTHSTDPKIRNYSVDHNISLTFVPEFSPSRSPCLPPDFEDEDVCGEDTPTPPHYKTPPQGTVLNSEQTKLVITLKRFNLAHHISTFLSQEVDMNLFLTLNDQDLMEIGIANQQDRKALLAVINAYTKHEKYY